MSFKICDLPLSMSFIVAFMIDNSILTVVVNLDMQPSQVGNHSFGETRLQADYSMSRLKSMHKKIK